MHTYPGIRHQGAGYAYPGMHTDTCMDMHMHMHTCVCGMNDAEVPKQGYNVPRGKCTGTSMHTGYPRVQLYRVPGTSAVQCTLIPGYPVPGYAYRYNCIHTRVPGIRVGTYSDRYLQFCTPVSSGTGMGQDAEFVCA